PGGGTHITLDKAEGTTARFDVAVDARATESRYLDIVAALEDSFPGVSFSLDGDSFDHAGDTAVKQVSDPLNQSGGIHTLTLTAQVSKDLKVGSYTHNVEFTIIDKRMPLTFTGALSVTKAYDGTADINPASIQIANPTSFDGLAGSEGFTLSAVGITSAAFTDATAGANKSVTYTGAFSLIDPQGGALASNYILIAPTLTGTIEAPPAPDTIELEATITAPGQWVTLNKYFDNAFTVDWGDGSTAENVTGNTPHTYAAVGTYTITLTSALTGNPYAVWTFTDVFAVLVPAFDTTADSVRVSYMPPMTVFMSDASTAPANFFAHFNDQGALTSLPAGSFDTSNITAAGDNFFYSFTRDNPLTSLPAGSFNTSNITTVGKSFFAFFNYGGALTALPAGSFDTGGITAAGDDFFAYFNDSLSGPGALASLPDGSFDTGNITTVGNGFFTYFNNFGHLTSLPDGSFDTGNITTVGNDFFAYFNNNGALVSLPDGSFNTSAITAAGNACFKAFNVFGALDSLPDGSFDTSAITAAGDNFFSIFNSQGALTSLPASFKWPPLDLTAASQPGNFQRAFYSSATLNRSAQDIINGCATPDTDRSTFSSNQPGHSALDPNWQG
ncbi:MAG: YDG domain-containing protein, partial [Coriobacteriales bacterium]|nr:YDG domain-containing protein [Coriobacteriales bacterium]